MVRSNDEAHAILEPYFLAARELFAKYCDDLGLDGREVAKTKFECRSEMHDTERHFAGTTLDGRKVLAAPEMADLPEDTVAAIFAHEFGHVVDHRYPSFFVFSEERLIYVGPVEGEDRRAEQARVARMKQWDRRNYHEVEVTADLLAEAVTGSRIGYSGKCMLQGLNRGVARPEKLR